MTLIDKAEALAAIDKALNNATGDLYDAYAAIRALPARGVGVKPEAAETLAKEMQAIVAADRWKGRDLNAAPPEKWSHLRPETQQFWIDTATRILAAIAPTDAAQAREAALREAIKAAMGVSVFNPAALQAEINTSVMVLAKVEKAILALLSEPRT